MKSFLTLAVLFLLLTPIAAGALDTETRVVGPVRTWNQADLQQYYSQRLQVKFVEGSNVRLDNGCLVDDSGLDLVRVNTAIDQAKALAITPLFKRDRTTLRAWKARGQARSGMVGPDLSLWFNIRLAGGRAQVAQLVNALNRCPEVEIAHPVPIPRPAVIIAHREDKNRDRNSLGGTPDFTGLQGYLYDTPLGLDAPAAWALPGGRGEGMKFIDVEFGWTEDHEDFAIENLFYVGGSSKPATFYENHGTAVLGEVIGQPNGYGITGFAPQARYGLVSAYGVESGSECAEFFEEAMNNLDPGEVWLIELEGGPGLPMEYYQANFDVIWTSVFSLGIACVETGGNGGQDLDDPVFGGIFDRSVRDSGAIMVAAGTPTGRVAETYTDWGTNWGSRMDAHGWGSEIVTTGYGHLYNGGSAQTRYTDMFGGGSGAGSMVLGACLCIQGIAKAHLGSTLHPLELRSILHDTGIEHLDPIKEIGPRPDLGAASECVISLDNSMVVAGPGPAYDNPSLVRVFLTLQDAMHIYEFSAYGASHYGIDLSCGDLDGDLTDEIITGPGPGNNFGPHVRGFLLDGTPLPGLSFLAYGTNKWGVNVAAGDIDADGYDEIITGAGPGAVFGPHVRAFDYDGAPGVEPVPGVSYFAYGTPKWGVNVSAGDIDGDGFDEIVTGAGPGAVYGPHVRGWNVDGGAAAAMPSCSYFAYGTHKYGVNVSCGDVDGDGMDEIVTGAGPGAVFGAHVRGWNYDGVALSAISGINFFAWGPDEVRYGAKVFAGADLNDDGRAELVVGCGPDPEAGTPVKVYLYDGAQVTEWFSLEAFMDLDITHGTNVAAGRF